MRRCLPNDDAELPASLNREGFVLVPQVYAQAEVAAITARLTEAMEESSHAKRLHQGGIYAARNVDEWFPEVHQIWRHETLRDLLDPLLGSGHGLVRTLYFDKHPERPWTLAWHKDLTIAVREHRSSSAHFSKPTIKAGVPHVEAPEEVLRRMLTVRLHLDDVTEENGPLQVIPGSHRSKNDHGDAMTSVAIHAAAGDVLLMRPLLTHRSGSSAQGTPRHRRILHFELSPQPELQDGYEWHQYLRS